MNGRVSSDSIASSTLMSPPSTAATALAIGMSTCFARASSTSTGAVSMPSASLLFRTSSGARPWPSAMPTEKLRDCSARTGEDEIAQAGEAGQRFRRARHRPCRSGTIRRNPRVISAAAALAPSLRPVDDAGGDRQHVLGRAADLDAAHVGRMIGPERRRAERARKLGRAASRRAAQASRRSAARAPRRWQSSGRRGSAGARARRALGDHFGHEFMRCRARCPWRRRRPACRAASTGSIARATVRKICAGTTISTASPRAAQAMSSVTSTLSSSATPGSRGFVRVLAERGGGLRIARPQRHAAPGARDDIGERGSPGAGSEHDDAVECHLLRSPSLQRYERARYANCGRMPMTSSSGQRARGAARRGRSMKPCASRSAPGPGDHRAVVGAQRRRRHDQDGFLPRTRSDAAPCGSSDWRRPRRRRPARSARRSAH